MVRQIVKPGSMRLKAGDKDVCWPCGRLFVKKTAAHVFCSERCRSRWYYHERAAALRAYIKEYGRRPANPLRQYAEQHRRAMPRGFKYAS